MKNCRSVYSFADEACAGEDNNDPTEEIKKLTIQLNLKATCKHGNALLSIFFILLC